MIMGVGSITDAAAASLFIQMGANFIVTPSLREDIAVTCNRRKIMYSPGCGSLTEINRAEELGVEIIKLFPGSTYGPGFVKAIKGPQPWTSIMPTGGVSTETDNLKAWFASGVTCVGMGSQLISKKVLADQDYAGLEALVSDTLKNIKEIRSGL
jgi:2-dehydro-3-deoxyphosphogluconate aldolase/(4S)-4-hydroxy-2-oxoglutarate aldolase